MARPLLRGWLHAGAAAGAIVVTIPLLVQTRHDLLRCVSLLVFGLSMVELYTVSAIYHVGMWQGRRRRVLRALDHASIFVLIAGTYTPISVNVLTGPLRLAVLGVIWALAIVGVMTAVSALRLPRWGYTGLYVAMGWVALVPLPRLTQLLPWQPLALLVAGGVLYTAGAVIYWLRRPDPLPRIFGFHEVFHLFVIAGSVAFVTVIWIWVVPYPRA
jgi:hemolysin III